MPGPCVCVMWPTRPLIENTACGLSPYPGGPVS